MGRQQRSNIPTSPEIGQYKNVPLHNFAVRKGASNATSISFEMCPKTKKKVIEESLQFDLNFDVFSYTKSELYAIVYGLFYKVGLIELLSCSEQEFVAFLSDVDKGYFDNPYHSFHHCIDVFYIVYFGLEQFGASKWLKTIDILGILIAALCHDIAHPGVNNLYQVNARTKLAVLYNDMSVLESYSCSQTFNLINKHSFFKNLSKADYSSVRGTIVKGIMATDMNNHFDLLEKLQNFLRKFDRSKELDLESKRLIMSSILHAADISNPCRPWTLCKKWSDFVVEEFFLQGDLEKLNSLPMSPNMDREVSNQPSISTGFIDFLVRPFYEVLCQLLPKFKPYLDQLGENRRVWQVMKEEQESKKKEKEGSNTDIANSREPLPGASRRLSVAAGTITIPSDVVARLSKQASENEISLSVRPRDGEDGRKKSQQKQEDELMKGFLGKSLKFSPEEISTIKSNAIPETQKKSIDKVVLLLELSSVLIEVEKEMCQNPHKLHKLLAILSSEISIFLSKTFSSDFVRVYLVDEERSDILVSRAGFEKNGDGSTKRETNDENIISVVHNNESILQKVVEDGIEYPYVLLSPLCLTTAPQKLIGVVEIRRMGEIYSDEEIRVIGQMCNMISPKLYSSYLEEIRELANR